MAIICWGNLAKSADDTERIEQAIQGYVEDHNENVNAHMGEGYALGAHRLQTVLDHPYGSIRYWHVEDIHAEAIKAGGIVVRGNGPYVSVQDDEGVERVKIYPEGVIIKKGKVAIETENDKVVLDSIGLYGNNIFYSGQLEKVSDQNIPGDMNWYFITPLEVGLYLKRTTPVMFFGNIQWSSSGNDANFALRIQYPTGYFPRDDGWIGPLSGGDVLQGGMISFNHIIQLYAGSNLVRLVGARTTPDETVKVLGLNKVSTFGYMVLSS